MNRMLLEIPDCFDTTRLHVCRYQAGDGAAYWAMAQRNRVHLFPFEAENPVRSLQSEQEAEGLVHEFAALWALRQSFFFGAWDRRDQTFVAQIYVGVVNWDLPEFELGYFVDVDHEGQGYVTEAATGALAFIFDHLQAHRVLLRCSDANPRSARVAERCGFSREAHLRQNRRLADGTLCGEYYYGLLREEYRQNRNL
ncbi:MAG: GNAT family N-acetyltransferase [Anaerolineae bacterium]|nr:GNAT family N-acetyltransferase [Anaerolineae bacterium]